MEFGIWGHILDTFCLLIGHTASKNKKTSHGSSNNDVINLKSMIKRYTFSSISQVLWSVALKLGILWPFILLMTNNYKLVSKKVKYICRLCNDDIIIVPDMLHRDIQLYCLSLRAYH